MQIFGQGNGRKYEKTPPDKGGAKVSGQYDCPEMEEKNTRGISSGIRNRGRDLNYLDPTRHILLRLQ